MARVTAQQVSDRAAALLKRDTGRRVIVLEADPKTDEAVCYAVRVNGRWTEHTYASAGVAYGLDPEPDKERA